MHKYLYEYIATFLCIHCDQWNIIKLWVVRSSKLKILVLYDILMKIVEGCIAGGVAGVAVEAALYPIDTIKTRLQVNSMYWVKFFNSTSCVFIPIRWGLGVGQGLRSKREMINSQPVKQEAAVVVCRSWNAVVRC